MRGERFYREAADAKIIEGPRRLKSPGIENNGEHDGHPAKAASRGFAQVLLTSCVPLLVRRVACKK